MNPVLGVWYSDGYCTVRIRIADAQITEILIVTIQNPHYTGIWMEFSALWGSE